MTTIINIIAVIVYTALNFVTANRKSAKEMKRDFVDGQCLVGKIFANIFYAPAWLLKGLHFIVVATIK